MTKFYFLCFIALGITCSLSSQNASKADSINLTSDLFSNSKSLDLKLSYSIKDLRKTREDTLYIRSFLTFEKGKKQDSIKVRLKARGNFRFMNCYFPPLKVKIKKKESKGTLFEGHKTLKIVLPCLKEKDKNDNVLKEYLAYKFYEILTEYHFRTRLLNVEFDEIRKKKLNHHTLKGILIEDDKVVAKRHNGKVFDRFSHPLNHDDLASVRNAFFQFMIGNTDFSTAYRHNGKLLFIDKKMIPVSYDFDMSGFVNCSYAIVSQTGKNPLSITSVTERKYRGFKRDISILNQVRKEYQNKQLEIVSILNNSKHLFDDIREFNAAKAFIYSFFKIINDDKKFKNHILDDTRTE
ncbi:hypothetical protein A9Q87_00305 [Flavobacteriales bacterium 34_180_T64]|nr:hypothetical protein A9Q87_00305 [Flavobacteriales bacterium 34_180_T64]